MLIRLKLLRSINYLYATGKICVKRCATCDAIDLLGSKINEIQQNTLC